MRSQNRKTNWFIWAALVCLSVLGGCKEFHDTPKQDCIIQCANYFCIDSAEFSYELSLKLAAYPYDLRNDPDEYNQTVIDLAANLAEQAQLLCAATESGIKIPSDELEEAEKALREGYSDEAFEQVMVEEALRYQVWKQKLEKKLLIQEFIRVFLLEDILVSQEELSDFYALQVEQNKGKEPDWIKDTDVLLARLKEKKAQEIYETWMQEVRESYPVNIDREMLKQFLIHPHESEG